MPSTSANPSALTTRQLLGWMFGFVRPVKSLVFLACLYLTLWISFEILAVRQTAEAVNRIKVLGTTDWHAEGGFIVWIRSDNPSAVSLRQTVLVLAGLALAVALLTYLREVANAKMSMHMVFYIREAVYDKLQQLGFGFHDAVTTGEVINRSLTDLQHVRQFIQSAVLVNLEIVLIVGGYITLLLTRSPWLAGLAMAPLPFWTWYILKFSQRVQPALRAAMEAGDKDVSLITENIAGVHVVKAFGTEQQEIEKYALSCVGYFGRVMARIRLFANFTPVIRSIAIASHLALFLAAGILIIHGRLLPGDLLMLGAAMGAILGRLQQVSVVNDQYQHAIVSARRLHEVLSARPTIPDQAAGRPLPPGPGAVRFEHVTFGYDPAKPVLHDVSFEVAGGSTVAIVGPTGGGKTTLVNLIARFYDPGRGRIFIDGVDIRDVSLDDLRRQVAFVFQETFLFSETVDANIAYSRPSPASGQVEAASRLAQAHDFVESLPFGYETTLGERGTTLSGGQRQRLAIARAILADPRILILDDATAAVDSETEDLIHRATRFVMKDRTTFVIAHRISTVERADRVVVLENGRVTQFGTHRELMLSDGHYRDIAEVQLYGDRLVRDDDGDVASHMDRVGLAQRTGETLPATAAPESASAQDPRPDEGL